jgi:hypothetical protein
MQFNACSIELKKTSERCFHNVHKKNRLLTIYLILNLKLTYYGKQLNNFP